MYSLPVGYPCDKKSLGKKNDDELCMYVMSMYVMTMYLCDVCAYVMYVNDDVYE